MFISFNISQLRLSIESSIKVYCTIVLLKVSFGINQVNQGLRVQVVVQVKILDFLLTPPCDSPIFLVSKMGSLASQLLTVVIL